MQCEFERNNRDGSIEYCTKTRNHGGSHFFGGEAPPEHPLREEMVVTATFRIGTDLAAITNWIKRAPGAQITTNTDPQ